MPQLPAISIILPTYNEAEGLPALLRYLRTEADAAVEILVADAASPDGTAAVARAGGARVVACPQRGRAAQLNCGARAATGQVLYFLHADTYPPRGFPALIRAALAAGAGSGCFRLRFNHPHWFLRLSAWFTRFDVDAIRFGDQSLFVRRAVFERAGGFRPELQLMEDQEIVPRLRWHGPFRVLPQYVTTSARKYLVNGVYRLQASFTLLAVLHWLGVSQPRLVRLYRRLIA
ncbi:TIGR04283 family arsenosugar biosynthesis glycosyltransferase [Hymenobacter metallilatus]|uniref:TIGR04283 family arsenosugar biosynthesis glycosyltransferase n=1 Tax=Hymenobacter metallilatus TaxID=2493666 RepID=UPI001FE6E5DE|nr:TIGR04283 family arsenosugar biosynthesis glycosyltransferase [Hymenobacter metallilatus]